MNSILLKSILTVLVLATSIQASADEAVQQNVGTTGAPPYSVMGQNRASNGKSVWMTMYNMFGSVREARCVRDGDQTLFEGYMPPLRYFIRAEVKENVDCGGATLADLETEVEPTRGVYAKLLSYPDGGGDAYMWRVTMSPEAQRPEAQRPEQLEDSAQANAVLEGHNALRNGKTVWVTIYNVFDDIRDYGCLQPGERHGWSGYNDFGFAYRVRFEVKDGANCSGATIHDTSVYINDVSGMKGARIMNIQEGGQLKYITAKYE